MAFGHPNKQRRKRPLEATSSSNMSVGRLCLAAIAIAAIGTHAPLATAVKSINNPLHRVANLRGGSSTTPSGGGSGDQLNDEDLDEYIDFLLAYADDKATEEDNPLFKAEREAAEALLENLEESTAVEEEHALEDAHEEVHHEISSSPVVPLVDDVDDDRQIDSMVETLVASVDDKDLEDESEASLEDAKETEIATIATPIEIVETDAMEATTPETSIDQEEEVVESETFYLGSSAVDNMPPPLTVEETTAAAEAPATSSEEEEPPKQHVPLFSSLMQKIGLKKEEVPKEFEEIAESIGIVEEADADPIVVEETAIIEEENVELDESELVEEPVEEREPSEEIAQEEEENPKVDRMKQLMAPMAATVTALDATKTSVVSSVKNYYEGAMGSARGVWNNRPWKPAPPERDYSKIYEKYFAATPSEDEVHQPSPNRLASAFLKPWGTVTAYFPKQILSGAEDSYSIGITGFVPEESFVAEIEDSSETQMEVVEVTDNEEVAEDSQVIEGATESEAVDEEIMESIEVEADAEEVQEDTEVMEEDAIEDADSLKVIEEDAEVVSEDIEVVAGIEDIPVDIEILAEGFEAEIDGEEVEEVDVDVEELLESTEVVKEDFEAETVDEDISEDTEIELGLEDEDEDIAEVVGEGTEVEVESPDVLSDTEETLFEIDQSADSSEDTPAEVPRRVAFFTRLWGTTKVQNTVDPVEADGETNEIMVEETLAETDDSIDDQEIMTEETLAETEDFFKEITSDESSQKRNIFARLWGVSKEPQEIYSLGLQGNKKAIDSEIGEDVDIGEDNGNNVGEEVDVDVSVSIGIVEEGEESLDSLEISESSGVEDVEDDIEDDIQLKVLENEEINGVTTEDTQSDRNVFQLHVSESQDGTEEMSPSETESVEVTNGILDPEASTESGEISTLQLHQEGSILVSDVDDDIILSDEAVDKVFDDSEIEIEQYPDAATVEEDAMVSEAEYSDLLEEPYEVEDEYEFIVDGIDQGVESDESEKFAEQLDEEEDEEVFVKDNFEDQDSEESEDIIEILDEEEDEEEGSFITATAEDLVSDDAEDFIEQEELEEDIEEDPINISGEVFEDIEMDESEEEEQLGWDVEEQIYVEDIDEDESSPYSLEVEMQDSNVVSRFLVDKGLEQLIMIAIVLSELFRAYILAPFLESFNWIKEGKAQDLLQTVINTRGGALALSESEDHTDEEEELSGEELSAESGSLSDSQEESTERDNPAEGE